MTRSSRCFPTWGAIEGAEAITVEQLLNHTSGLPFGAEVLDVDDPNRTAAQVVAQLDGIALRSTPGAGYHYSSLVIWLV